MARPTRTIRLAALALVMIAPAPVAAQTPLFEVEKGDATKLLQVNDDAGFVVRGTLNAAGTIPATGEGIRLMWYPKKGAFRAGSAVGAQWDDGNTGILSAALGQSTTASADFSTALGFTTVASGGVSTAMGDRTTASGNTSTSVGKGSTASGDFATAMGNETTASGLTSTALGFRTVASGVISTAMGNQTTASASFSTAMGVGTTASGDVSSAMGQNTTASGNSSTAIGFGTTASGHYSTAMGVGTKALGQGSVAMGGFVSAGTGSFVFGDGSTTEVQAAGDNQFLVRAYGGIGFNSAPLIGCDLNPGEGAWSCTSSRLAKEGFEDVDGEMVLGKLATIPIQRWRYLGTEAAHLGPTAEDFHAAFGLGEESTKISTVDADGIALRAVQALERRTAELRAEVAALRAQVEALTPQAKPVR